MGEADEAVREQLHQAATGDIKPMDEVPPPSLAEVKDAFDAASRGSPPISVVDKQVIALPPLPYIDKEEDKVVELIIQHWTFSNGSTVTFCRTPFAADSVNVSAFAVGGSNECGAAVRRYLQAASMAQGGVLSLKRSDLEAAASTVRAYGYADFDGISRRVWAGGSPQFLREAFALAWSDLKAPRFDLRELQLSIAIQKKATTVDKLTNDPGYWMHKATRCFMIAGAERREHKRDKDKHLLARLLSRGAKCYNEVRESVLPLPLSLQLEVQAKLRGYDQLQRPGVTRRIAASWDQTVGNTPASAFSWTMVGALPPDDDLESILLTCIPAFDSAPQSVIVEGGPGPDPASSEAKSAALKGDSVPALALRMPGRVSLSRTLQFARQSKHVDVCRNVEEQSSTKMTVPCAPISAEMCPEDAKLRIRSREFACDIAQALLLRRLRQDLGLVYSVSCWYTSFDHCHRWYCYEHL